MIDRITYHRAYTDPQAIAELGPTECGLRCGRLLSPEEPWVSHNGHGEHVECHRVAHVLPQFAS
jgi:hypothetical protein